MHGRNFSEDEYANYTLARGKLIGESLSFLELLR